MNTTVRLLLGFILIGLGTGILAGTWGAAVDRVLAAHGG